MSTGSGASLSDATGGVTPLLSGLCGACRSGTACIAGCRRDSRRMERSQPVVGAVLSEALRVSSQRRWAGCPQLGSHPSVSHVTHRFGNLARL